MILYMPSRFPDTVSNCQLMPPGSSMSTMCSLCSLLSTCTGFNLSTQRFDKSRMCYMWNSIVPGSRKLCTSMVDMPGVHLWTYLMGSHMASKFRDHLVLRIVLESHSEPLSDEDRHSETLLQIRSTIEMTKMQGSWLISLQLPCD